MNENASIPVVDEITLTQEDPCADGICKERLCGRMKRELRFFSFLADEDLDEVAGYFECRQLPSGKTLWQEGDPANFVAFIVTGRVGINKTTEFGGKPIVIGIFSRGSMIGELSLLENAPRSETAVVMDHVDLIVLTRKSFQRLLEERPQLGIKLLEGMLLTVSRRLKKSYERLVAIF
jgi:CRP/FNR family cyclic AMP-dependent transcriptional regulator